MSCQPIITPQIVLDLIEPGQQILFIGFYDVADRNIQNNGLTSTLSMNICTNPSGYNLRVVIAYKVNDIKIPEVNFLQETYAITSWDSVPVISTGKIIGEINFTGLYDNGNSSGTITAKSAQKFNVNSSNGIYEDASNVIIDFTNPVRVVYFIGNCENHTCCDI
jgi:hypothetical protein